MTARLTTGRHRQRQARDDLAQADEGAPRTRAVTRSHPRAATAVLPARRRRRAQHRRDPKARRRPQGRLRARDRRARQRQAAAPLDTPRGQHSETGRLSHLDRCPPERRLTDPRLATDAHRPRALPHRRDELAQDASSSSRPTTCVSEATTNARILLRPACPFPARFRQISGFPGCPGRRKRQSRTRHNEEKEREMSNASKRLKHAAREC